MPSLFLADTLLVNINDILTTRLRPAARTIERASVSTLCARVE
jgi:hypothetical protein